tara:strand:- start:80788 stop:81288 length:501 start_codon:yes stop_codon:yes gene_type:complete
MNKLFFIFLWLSATLCSQENSEEVAIQTTLDNWHKAAANANFEDYFQLMTSDGVFIGTDATENWQNTAFREFSKPYFEAGKAWSFSTLERHVYLNEAKDFAWFDELLDTQMEICRGSGVLKKSNGQWKIAHYVLSIAVPNDKVDELVLLKKEADGILKKRLKAKHE